MRTFNSSKFRIMSLTGERWEELLISIHEKSCVPIIGAGTSIDWWPAPVDISQAWAVKYDYPLYNSNDLASVAEFMILNTGDWIFPKKST